MGIGQSVKRVLADECSIDPRTQFYVYGWCLGIVVVFVVTIYPGAAPLY
jgi:hypothetical protein